MAEKDQDGPSLELPSLGFGRKRKKAKATAEPEPPVEATPEPQPAPEPPAERVGQPAEAVDEAAAVAEPEREPRPEPADVPEPEPDQSPTTIIDDDQPADASSGRPLFADDPEVGVVGEPQTVAAPVATDADEPAAHADPTPAKRKREFRLPDIGGIPAAIVTGLLVGVLTVGLTWASLRLCEVLQGTSSCGGPGLFLLLAIMIAMIFLGAALLRAWGLPDPGSTSFLAVGLLAVVALLFLVDLLFNWWMIIVIPLVAIATFTLSHWVTATFIEPAEGR